MDNLGSMGSVDDDEGMIKAVSAFSVTYTLSDPTPNYLQVRFSQLHVHK